MNEIKCDTLATVWQDGDGPGHHEIRVVRWNDGAPVVEKRQYFMSATGVKPGKCKGFNLADVTLLFAKQAEILKALAQ